jgi:hypothetical protein
MEGTRTTGKFDIEGNEIFEGDTLLYKDINGKMNEFKVKWSNYRKDFIGDALGEIYDLSSKYFCKSIKKI